MPGSFTPHAGRAFQFSIVGGLFTHMLDIDGALQVLLDGLGTLPLAGLTSLVIAILTVWMLKRQSSTRRRGAEAKRSDERLRRLQDI